MGIFTLNFFLVFVWAVLIYLLPVGGDNKKKIFLGIVFCQFTFLAWQRDFSVGQDTIAYYIGFQNFESMSFAEVISFEWEPGYNLSNWIVAKLGGDFHLFLLIVGAFIYYSFLRFIYYYSENVWLSVVAFIAFGYYFGSLHILRQYIAISIILYSYPFIQQRRLIPFLLTVAIASSFHLSAILFVVTWFLCRKKLSNKRIIISFGICIAVAFLIGKLLMGYLSFFEVYSERYITASASGEGYGMLSFLALLLCGGLMVTRMTIDNKIIYWTFFIAVCLQPFATVVSMVARGILYWLVSIIIFIPMVVSAIKNFNSRLMAYGLVLVSLVVFFVFISNSAEGVEDFGTYKWYVGN